MHSSVSCVLFLMVIRFTMICYTVVILGSVLWLWFVDGLLKDLQYLR